LGRSTCRTFGSAGRRTHLWRRSQWRLRPGGHSPISPTLRQGQKVLNALLGDIVARIKHKDFLIRVQRRLQVPFGLRVSCLLQCNPNLLPPLYFDLLLAGLDAKHNRNNQD
jgi:hypothetical protein